MLDRLMQIIGVDFDAKLAQVTARAVALKETTKQEFRAELAHFGFVAACALAAFFSFAATCVIALIALYSLLKPEFGATIALAIVGGITAVFGLMMLAFATNRKSPETIPVPETIVSQTVVATPRPASPPLDLATLVAPLPANASLLDVVAHRVSTRAAGAADEAIDAAEESIANGSRVQLVGTLAAAILVGWAVGRRGGL